MNIGVDKLNSYDELNSIDEAIEQLHVDSEITIPPEVEFWGHCSNIQSWVEYNYDTTLLEMRLAFPLLKALADAGDSKAKIRLSEEILKRFNEGNKNVREYLIFENFFGYLKDYEIFYHLLNEVDATSLVDIIVKYKRDFVVETFVPLRPRRKKCYLVIKKKKIDQMGLWLDEDCEKIPKEISKFKHLRRLIVFTNKYNPNTSIQCKNIEHLHIYIKGTNEPKFNIKTIDLFPNLKSFGIYSDYKSIIKPNVKLYDCFEKLKKLESLSFDSIKIEKLPETISKLTSLKWLIIYYSYLKYLPKQIFNLNSLEVMILEGTNLKTLPISIISNNTIKYFACEPHLVNTELLKWIKKQKLTPFKEKTYKREDFSNFPVVG